MRIGEVYDGKGVNIERAGVRPGSSAGDIRDVSECCKTGSRTRRIPSTDERRKYGVGHVENVESHVGLDLMTRRVQNQEVPAHEGHRAGMATRAKLVSAKSAYPAWHTHIQYGQVTVFTADVEDVAIYLHRARGPNREGT